VADVSIESDGRAVQWIRHKAIYRI